jgi:hypothetical protein
LQPDYVEIITWNDWGESHYIAPIDPTQYQSVLSLGKAPFDFVGGLEHQGWTYLLPVFTDLYKTNKSSITSEILVAWGRGTSVNIDCFTNGTTVNTASQLQLEFPPNQALSDSIFFAMIANGQVDDPIVTIGGTRATAGWSDIIGSPTTGGTILLGNASFIGLVGDIEITIERLGKEVLSVTGSISDSCTGGFLNYNMWTNYALVGAGEGTSISIEDYTCTAGTSVEGFSDLCEFTCSLGYCKCHVFEQVLPARLSDSTCTSNCGPVELTSGNVLLQPKCYLTLAGLLVTMSRRYARVLDC